MCGRQAARCRYAAASREPATMAMILGGWSPCAERCDRLAARRAYRMLLQHQTWQEVEVYLSRSNGIIMPIGSTEQHGPNGLIGTDAICAEVIARGVGEAADAMVGPTIGVGVAV